MPRIRPLLLAAALLAAAPSLHAQAGAKADPLASRTIGSPNAPVTVYEMSDFQCPFCARHALQTWPTIEKEYVQTGKVRWVFVNFPLTDIHPNAVPTAELAMCAGRQGKFWPVHDLIFRNQKTWAPLKEPGQYLLTLADSAGLDRKQVTECLRTGATRAEIEADAKGADEAGAASTPTFYIEGGLLKGAQPIQVFRQVLDQVIAEKTRAKAKK